MGSSFDYPAQQGLAETLALANTRFDEALRSARHIMYRLNVRQGGYDYLSPFFEELTGYPLAEFKQISLQKLPDYFHPEDRERIFGENGEFTRIINRREETAPFLLVEYRLRKADGSYCWLRDQNTVYFGADGQIESVVGSAYDITEQKQLIQTLQEHEAELRVLFESSRAGIILVDPSGKIVIANQRMAEMFDCSMAELIGSTYPSHVHPEQHSAGDALMRKLISGEIDHVSTERRYLRKDGTEFWGYLSGRRHEDDDGNLISLVGHITDITAQKQAEEERLSLERQLLNAQKLESLGVLAGGIAHDFNNILTAIMGNISYAKTELEASSQSFAPLERAEKAAKRAAKLARQLLVFAKGGEPVKKFFLLPHTVTDAVTLVLSGTNVQAVFDLPKDLYAVNADEGQISQAFHNIILNAVQAMPAGGRLFVSGSNIAIAAGNNLGLSAGAYVKISIKDEGCGIEPEDLERVFDPYFTNKAGGSGLGLASTYTIIKKHAGHISVSSPPGKGAVFTVILPGFGKPETEETTVVPAAASGAGDCSILVMDDDEMVRELADITLKRLGYKVVSCPGGAEAVALYRTARAEGAPFTLCIMDLTIPGGMGGIEAARQILTFDPAAKLIVSSGYSDDPVMANFAAYGFCAALEKPYSVKEIDRILQTTKR